MLHLAFRRFVFASGLTNLADGVATVAWAWLTSLLTRDPLIIALVPVVLRLPWFLCAVPAGIVTDRVDRRRLIVAMDVLRALAFGGTALAIWLALPLAEPPDMGLSSHALFTVLILAASVVGVAEVFRDNAAQTMLPSLVAQDDLERANGRLWSVEMVGNALIGPALGASLLAFALPLPFFVNALAYLSAIALVAGLKGVFRPKPNGPRNWRRELKEGFAFLRDAPLLRALAWITGFWNLFFHMVLIALVLHVQENLGVDAQVYGLILTGGAIGGILGSWSGGWVVERLGAAKTAQISLLASVPAFLAIAFVPGPVSLAFTLAVFEFMGILWNTVSVSYRQRTIPDALLGRVNSLYRLLAWGMMPVGLLLSGVLVRLFDGIVPRETALILPFLVASLGALVLGVLGWRVLGRGFASAPK
ncbi:MFS transporter [Celeribacter sp. HF31]|uniref:MFS transporter n=1 Tax=Celeribacter sp. HF31 TaxID=2721558 RepID=UPI00142FC512|nr:MFS transporter [Celeribacter sp. HF31]NIY78367.1 MFS transporter [Celeribacter sp. HF31]